MVEDEFKAYLQKTNYLDEWNVTVNGDSLGMALSLSSIVSMKLDNPSAAFSLRNKHASEDSEWFTLETKEEKDKRLSTTPKGSKVPSSKGLQARSGKGKLPSGSKPLPKRKPLPPVKKKSGADLPRGLSPQQLPSPIPRGDAPPAPAGVPEPEPAEKKSEEPSPPPELPPPPDEAVSVETTAKSKVEGVAKPSAPSDGPEPKVLPEETIDPKDKLYGTIFGIFSVVLAIFWIPGILAVSFGHMALTRLDNYSGFGRKELAIAGIILGYMAHFTFLYALIFHFDAITHNSSKKKGEVKQEVVIENDPGLEDTSTGIFPTTKIPKTIGIPGRDLPSKAWFEAESPESMDGFAPFIVSDDETASKGKCIDIGEGVSSLDQPPANGHALYKFRLAEFSNVSIWLRVRISNPSTDSFWIDVSGDNEEAMIFYISPDYSTPESWIWVNWQQVELPPGTHDLDIAYREKGPKIDQILVTSDANFNP